MLYKLKTYYHTLKYLLPEQVLYRARKVFREKVIGNKFLQISKEVNSCTLSFTDWIVPSNIYTDDCSFTFLNQKVSFGTLDEIDWNYKANGKLWCYNLNYFDFLLQNEIDTETGESLINNFIVNAPNLKDGFEPYPTSLRNVNWIKFITRFKIKNQKYDNFIYSSYIHLLKNIEYHLMGNHLLENGFSLLVGAYYLENDKLYRKAYSILKEQLSEQILADGAHFELSPMYHQIILNRVLDSYNLVTSNHWINDDLQLILQGNGIKMLSWLSCISFKDESIPLLNDSANFIAPTTTELKQYAKVLGIQDSEDLRLKESGYRKLSYDLYEIITDVGQIGPSYIPGHAHADTLSFVLKSKNGLIIVDPGISTYEKNERRNKERSTQLHNTVTLNKVSSSDVWGGFRVGRRAEIIELNEEENFISATHDGYLKDFGALHNRVWKFYEDKINIYDTLKSRSKNKLDVNATAHLHFLPDLIVEQPNAYELQIGPTIKISSTNEILLEHYMYCEGFNKLTKAIKACINFSQSNKIEITFLLAHRE